VQCGRAPHRRADSNSQADPHSSQRPLSSDWQRSRHSDARPALILPDPEKNLWTKLFPDRPLVKAVVDRITHKAYGIDTGTESWRFRHGLDRKKGHKA
jgi:hypothetical protein